MQVGAQDCAQSLEGGNKDQPGCRFRDDNGLCYAYNSAQMYCKNNANVKNCNDGGEKWATSPRKSPLSLPFQLMCLLSIARTHAPKHTRSRAE